MNEHQETAALQELAGIMSAEIRAAAAAKRDCLTCTHSMGADLRTAQRLREQGYRQGRGAFRHDVGLICEKHRIVAPEACRDYERVPGGEG